MKLGAGAFICIYVGINRLVDLGPGIDCQADLDGDIQLVTLIADPNERQCHSETVNGIV